MLYFSTPALFIYKMCANFKKSCVLFLSFFLFLSNQPAYADFRKALDAYIARDGDTLLKEVKDAVNKKNDDGLMLFLMATNMDAATSDYDATTKQSKSTLIVILPQPKWDEMRELLVQATNNSTVDAQYLFFTSNQFGNPRNKLDKKFIENYVKRGSRLAELQSNLQDRAEAGDVIAQLSLGFKYMNFVDEYGCKELSAEPICLDKDEVKSNYWLERATKGYEASGHNSFGNFADKICEYFRYKANGNVVKLRQAYLWCLVGVNTPRSESTTILGWMHKRGELRAVSPELNSIWENESKRNKILYRTNLPELPDLIVEARAELSKEDIPIFTYFENIYLGYELDVFADGRVKIGFGNEYQNAYLDNKSLWIKVSPETVKHFIDDLKQTGFQSWPIITKARLGYACTDNFTSPNSCKENKFQFTFRNGLTYHKKFLTEFDRVPVDNQSTTYLRASKIYRLTEKYFSTRRLRCDLSNSQEHVNTCLFFDNQLKNLNSKEE